MFQTYAGIANPDRILGRTHLCPEFAFSVEVELLHDAVISRLQHLDLGATQVVARRQMRGCSTTECQHLDAGDACGRNDVCCEVLYSSRLEAGQ